MPPGATNVSDALLGNYLIGLREGLEATLVVSILVAFLVKSGRRERLGQVWLGAWPRPSCSPSASGRAHLHREDLLSFEQQELFEAVTSILAVVFVTWMIFWMRRFARSLAGDLRGRARTRDRPGRLRRRRDGVPRRGPRGPGDRAALLRRRAGRHHVDARCSASALASPPRSALGWLIYAGAIRINLAMFFRWTGLVLILVAAGIFKYGVHDLQEAGVLPGLTTYAFDLSGSYDGSTWYAALLGGMFNFTATPTVLEIIAWVAYVVPVLVLFLLPPRPAVDRRRGRPRSAPTSPPPPASLNGPATRRHRLPRLPTCPAQRRSRCACPPAGRGAATLVW